MGFGQGYLIKMLLKHIVDIKKNLKESIEESNQVEGDVQFLNKPDDSKHIKKNKTDLDEKK